MRVAHFLVALFTLTAILAFQSHVEAGTTQLTSRRVAQVSSPVLAISPIGDYERLFIVQQSGIIRILDLRTNTLMPTPFLNISSLTNGGGERGLLGLAFHPDYANNGRFFVHYTNTSGTTTIRRYEASTTNPNVANTASGTTILTQSQPFSNHNGGMIAFSPVDGYLYIGLGDGGSGNDPQNNSQNNNTMLGKILRIDVDATTYISPADNPFVGVAGRDEIWATGIRNPWRFSFDSMTGDLYIGDVGQNAIEEVDFQSFASTGGENYGWRCMEGNNCTGLSGCTCNSPSLTDPIRTYNHSGGNCSITGGYVYRGCSMPDMHGIYFYGDYCSAQIWSFKYDGVTLTEHTTRTSELDPPGSQSIAGISGFGQDGYGELYVCDLFGGEVFKILPADYAANDCNGNLVDDDCELSLMPNADCNNNGILDDCEAGITVTDPVNVDTCVGQMASFSVTAGGAAAPTYQWQKDGNDIPGANSATFAINPVAASDAGDYKCIVTDTCFTAESGEATLTLSTPISILLEPGDESVCTGQGVNVFVAVNGDTPISYQWYKDGNPIPGANIEGLMLSNLMPADSGTYHCTISNNCGPVDTSTFEITVASCGTNFKRGDINADDSHDISDAIAGLDYLFAGGSPECLNSVDVNDDESADIADIIVLLDILFNGGGPAPAPYAVCGLDPTMGALGCDSFSACP